MSDTDLLSVYSPLTLNSSGIESVVYPSLHNCYIVRTSKKQWKSLIKNCGIPRRAMAGSLSCSVLQVGHMPYFSFIMPTEAVKLLPTASPRQTYSVHQLLKEWCMPSSLGENNGRITSLGLQVYSETCPLTAREPDYDVAEIRLTIHLNRQTQFRKHPKINVLSHTSLSDPHLVGH